MGYYLVSNETQGEREAFVFDDGELDNALVKFLETCRYDRKVRLEHVGKEYEEE